MTLLIFSATLLLIIIVLNRADRAGRKLMEAQEITGSKLTVDTVPGSAVIRPKPVPTKMISFQSQMVPVRIDFNSNKK